MARRSLLGLETRDGYGHLRDDAAPATSATEAPAAVESAPAAPAAPADVAYDEAPSDDDAAVSFEARDEALAIRCRVVRAPGLEGLCDGRSLRALLATVKPRALVALPHATTFYDLIVKKASGARCGAIRDGRARALGRGRRGARDECPAAARRFPMRGACSGARQVGPSVQF